MASDSSADRRNLASSSDTEAMPPPSPLDTAAELVRVLDQYMADLKSVVGADRAKLLADHPELAAQLEPCLAGIEFIHRATRPASSPSQLGDFRIVRELGRGGMGVVYEAEQISLRRRVALKVLRFGAVADKEAVERFRREAETVAHLHHTNIVPIFAVGAEQGVSYYAMQYIEGGSLADKMPTGKRAEMESPEYSAANAGQAVEGTPNSALNVARWGLEAAEALAHAHQRGVIHRDIKPSNLLLDTDGRVWLTDFGLARRIDEVTLTLSGMLMGTPRYMSPEQATAAKQPIDHRTDIYSLGATLYELATGQPVFASDTPHGVISQILTAEPVRPRIIRHSIPRDLETIILKCLSKEASQRYATAQSLADDLRAFREGRAIKARRAGLPERTVRWVQKRKKSVTVAAVAAAATLLVVVGLSAGLSSLAAARLAHVSVKSEGPPLKVEVFDEDERTAVATFTAPTQEPQAIPAGRYHVRLSADGHLSETSLFTADQGSYDDLTVALAPRNLWEIPVQNGESDELADVGGHDDLFLASMNQLRRLDGATGQPVWQVSLGSKDQPLIAKVLPTGDAISSLFGPRYNGGDLIPPCLVRPLVDVDGDGTPDLIWASRASASLVAISGKSGGVLWCHRSRALLSDGVQESDLQSRFSSATAETIVGQPLAVEIGGRKIVAAMCFVRGEIYYTKKDQWIRPPPQLWLDAVDAQTGDTLWRRPLPLKDENPETTPFTAAVGTLHDRKVGAIAYGNRLFGFDFLTGQPAWPDRQLDERSPVAVRFADLLGNGQLNVLEVREGAITKNYDPNGQTRDLFLVALSPASPTPLWELPLSNVTIFQQNQQADKGATFDWPLVVDLTGKGKPEVVVPFVDYQAGACGLEILDGATGKSRWRQPLSGASPNWRPPQPERIVVGPDLDGDGYRELFVAARDEQTYRVYVDAVSGRDGRSLWTYTRSQVSTGPFGAKLPPLRWWQTGADGWPLLVVSGANDQYAPPVSKPWSVVLAASSGRVEHLLTDFGTPEIADLNGDGLPDLFARRSDSPSQPYAAGKLHAIKGTPPEAWRMLSNYQFIATGDMNGDGFDDLVHNDNSQLRATSGRDGSLLWNTTQAGFMFTLANSLQRLQVGDLDGDGSPDLVTINNAGPRLNAISGRDGKVLWSVDLDLPTVAQTANVPPNGVDVHLGCHVMEAGHSPDVLLLYATMAHENGNERTQLWFARIAGRDGQIRWRKPMSEPSDLNFVGTRIPLALADLDGDGVNDIVFWMPLSQAEARPLASPSSGASPAMGKGLANPTDVGPPLLAPRYELRAVSGRDGKLLWRRPGFDMQYDDPQWRFTFRLRIPKPVVAQFDGDRQPTVVITDAHLGPNGAFDETSYAEVVALDGRDGKAKWTWRGDSGTQMGFWNDTWEKGSPQLVRAASGKAIVVSIYDRKLTVVVDPKTNFPNPSGKSGQQIVVLDPRGQVMRRTDIRSPGMDADRAKIWVADLNGDNHDEVVCIDGDRLRVMRPGDEKWLWEWPSSVGPAASRPVDVAEILPSGKTFPATIAVTTGPAVPPSAPADRVIGLAGPTGKPRWRFDTMDSARLLMADNPQGLPRVFTTGAGAERNCGTALPTDDEGKYQPVTPPPRKYEEQAENPRLLRPLPWAWQMPHSGIGLVNPLINALFWAIIVGLAVGKRPGKLRRAVWLVGLWVVVSLLAATVSLCKDAPNMAALQHYDWSGWYRIFVFGLIIATQLLLAGLILLWLFRFVRWGTRRLKRHRGNVSLTQ